MGTTKPRKPDSRREASEGYRQIKLSLGPETEAAFRMKCKAEGISMAQAISDLVSGQAAKNAKAVGTGTETRQKRRKALKRLVAMIGEVMDAEQRYIDNFPENLKGSTPYETAEETVSVLCEAMDLLAGAYE